MNDTHEDRSSVYEIGYLIATSVPEEKVPAEAEALRAIITGAGAEVISEEAPHSQDLAYTMRVKTLAGSYENYDSAYFGWVKFELSTSKIEAVKKAVEAMPSVLRMLLTTTVREQTYLGKKVLAAAKAGESEPKKDAEDADKAIDAMVKES